MFGSQVSSQQIVIDCTNLNCDQCVSKCISVYPHDLYWFCECFQACAQVWQFGPHTFCGHSYLDAQKRFFNVSVPMELPPTTTTTPSTPIDESLLPLAPVSEAVEVNVVPSPEAVEAVPLLLITGDAVSGAVAPSHSSIRKEKSRVTFDQHLAHRAAPTNTTDVDAANCLAGCDAWVSQCIQSQPPVGWLYYCNCFVYADQNFGCDIHTRCGHD